MDEELYDPECSACERAQKDNAELERVKDDVAALVRRLAHSLRKAATNNDLPEKALDYLRRQDIHGSPLRDADAVHNVEITGSRAGSSPVSPATEGGEGLGPLLDSEEDPARLCAEIHLLRAAVKGPDGYATWQQAATAERARRVKAEARVDLGKYAGTYGGYTTEPPKPRTLWQRFHAWRERTGFLMDGRDGGM